ncbi:SusC/RagA family TonB-linked outer membrane protein [Chitinophaga horti]|uniref:SusC/RagA family TonB-linked outer membrane protein n=1 Tax=Chitinophaga horti TaxID=2920382 RepID=A0ABY6J7N3_9BACT|nr:SusC/RagA family TonB-linked outer membrane protein [Chitinophaga horti]UYQ94307.1 SusC/RagA family TonB-linked outer membrane protein [Chitinophaga horti]
MRVVRLNAFFMLAFCLHISAKSVSQTVNYSASNVPLEKVFSVIKQQTGYVVMYNPDLLQNSKPVTVAARQMPLETFLKTVLDGQLGYTIEAKTIFIKPVYKAPAALQMGQVQDKRVPKISGTITGPDGAPLPVVNIAVKGSGRGAISDEDGKFVLSNVPQDAMLLIQLMGFKPIEVSVAACCMRMPGLQHVASAMNEDGSLQLYIRMEPTIQALEGVSVMNTGFQTLSKERATGAFTKVDSADLNAHLNVNLVAALEGKVAGLSMYRGEPIVRGVGTFSANVTTRPLLVIDGLITEGALEDVNPYDIESVTVLKDAAASSIYGARAANGVIVLTTKEGKKGQTTVTANVDYFINTKPDLNKMNYASTSDMIDYETDVFNYQRSRYTSNTDFYNYYGDIGNAITRYYSPLYQLYRDQADGKVSADQVATTLNQWRNNNYYNQYRDHVWQNEVRNRYNLSIAGGGDKVSTYMSINYDKNQMRVKENSSDNLNLYFKSTFKHQDWFTFTVGGNMGYAKEVSTASEYGDYLNMPVYTNIVDDNGNKVYQDWVNIQDGYSTSDAINGQMAAKIAANSTYKSLKFNILDELGYGHTTTEQMRLRGFTDMGIKLMKGLKYSMKFQYETTNNGRKTYDEAASYKMRYLYNAMTSINSTSGVITRYVPEGDRLFQLNAKTNNYSFRNQVDYDNIFHWGGKSHNITALAGFEIREIFTPVANPSLKYGFNPVTLTDVLPNWNTLTESGIISSLFGNTTLSYTPGTRSSEVRHRFASAYANFGYTYEGKYNLSGSVRVDQADLFGSDPKYRYRPLWSIGGGWNVMSENFMKDIMWLDYLKVRATYGIGGNVDQSSSPFITALLKSDNLYTNLQYIDISTMPNPKLRWEKTATLNFGIDFVLLKGLLRGSLDHYRKNSTDLLVQTDLDPTVGASSQTINNGAMSNRGIELSLSSDWLKKKDFSATTAITLAYNKNQIGKVTRMPTSAYSMISSPEYYFLSNTPYNSMYAYRYGGMTNGYPYVIDQTGKANVTFDANGVPIAVAQVNGTEAIYRVGTLIPPVSGSFRQSFSYKGIQLSALFAFYAGHKLRKDAMDFSGVTQIDEDITKRYRDGFTSTTVPRLEIDYPASLLSHVGTLSTLYRYSDINVADASSVRLRNLSLSYALPASATRFLHMRGLKLTAQANNLWMWTAAGDNIDPETFNLKSGTRNLPAPKSFLFGAALNF